MIAAITLKGGLTRDIIKAPLTAEQAKEIKQILQPEWDCEQANLNDLSNFKIYIRSIRWKTVHGQVVDFCLAIMPLNLPPYVMLEIFDWLPLMEHVRHYNKIRLIESCIRSYRKIEEIKKTHSLNDETH